MSKTNLANSIDTTEELIRRYNENVCNTLADSQILAYIMIHTMQEFSGWDIKDVILLIEDVSVRDTFIDPGYSNLNKVVGTSTVDLIPNEGEIRYDIRFSVRMGKEKIRILVNLEAQKSSDVKLLKYHIENRIQYYLARMISAQKNTEFVNDNYDDIKKVVSIWICMDANEDADGIMKYSFEPHNLYGKEVVYSEFDKMEAYIIRIRKNDDVEESKNHLIHMLEILLSKRKKTEVKRLLNEEHSLIMEVTGTEGEVNIMCNLGEALYEDAKQEGIEVGMKAGMEAGMEEKLKRLISLKLAKGMKLSEIAQLLEEDEEYVRELASRL